MFVTISLPLVAACLFPAAGKLLGHPRMRQPAGHFGIRWPRYRLIGVAELAAAAGILIGLWWHPSESPPRPACSCCLPARRGQRQGDGTSTDRRRHRHRLPGHRPHQLAEKVMRYPR